MLIRDKEETVAVFKMDFRGTIDEKGNLMRNPFEGNEKNWQKKLKPYFLWFIANSTLEDIKEKDLKYYNKLYSDIKVYKGETEIKMEALLRKSKSLRGINQILGFYH